MPLQRFDGTQLLDAMTPIGIPCRWHEGCEDEAVFLPCNAEGDRNRSHWGGWVHPLGDQDSNGTLCEAHGRLVLAENERIRNAA